MICRLATVIHLTDLRVASDLRVELIVGQFTWEITCTTRNCCKIFTVVVRTSVFFKVSHSVNVIITEY